MSTQEYIYSRDLKEKNKVDLIKKYRNNVKQN